METLGTEPGDEAADADAGAGEVVGRGDRTAVVAAAVVAVVVALLVGILATRDASSERQTQSPLLGRVAPAVQGTTLDGETFDIDEWRGRWVVVNFFASWCIPCREEHPQLVAFDEAHGAAGDAGVVSVTYDNRSDDARRFFEENGGDWPVVDDPENSIGVAYGVARVPESFLVSPSGIVVERLVGGVTAAQLTELIDQYEQAPR